MAIWKRQNGGILAIKNAEIHGALMQKENPEQISRQFATVESIDDYVDKAQQLGAKVIKNKNEI